MTKVGLFGIGLDTYWGQFDGLLNNLKGYQKQINDRIRKFGIEVIDAGMLDVYSDTTLQSAKFGTHIELLEMCELKKYRGEITDKEFTNKISEFHKSFDVSSECEKTEIERAALTSVTLDKLMILDLRVVKIC